jgi:hypothetical protein
LGRHETIPIDGVTIRERHHVDHAVAIERVIPLDVGMKRVLGIAEIHTLEIVGDDALLRKVGGVVLDVLRPPRPSPIWMVVVGWKSRCVDAMNVYPHVA